MSISKVHDLVQNKGCIWTISLLTIAGVVFGSFAQCGRAQQFGDTTGIAQELPIAQVGDQVISDRLLSEEMKQTENIYGNVDALAPEFQLQIQASTINSVIGNALVVQLAKKYGIEASDDEILRMLEKGTEDQLQQFKSQLVQQKKLKEDATEAEFAAAFKKATGKEISEVKQQILDTNKVRIEKKDLRIPLAAAAVQTPLMTAIQKTIKVSDEDIKKSYETYNFKKITIYKGNVDALAAKALAEVKGGLAFETAMERYSNDTPEKGKTLRDTITPIGRNAMEGFAPYKPLLDLKPGQVSDLVKTGSTTSIYKLISIKSDLPKDFEKNKETLRDSVATTKAASRLQGEIADLQKNTKIDWKSDGYRLVYEFGRLSSEPMASSDKNAKLKKMVEESLSAGSGDNPFTARMAHLVGYVAFNQLYSAAPPTEQAKMDEQKVEIMRAFLEDREDAGIRLELAETFKKKRDAASFADELMNAANANSGALDAMGQGYFNRINKAIKEGQDAKLLTATQVKDLQEIQRLWATQKAEQDKIDAENRKADEQARKEAEEAEKKASKAASDQVKTRSQSDKASASKPK